LTTLTPDSTQQQKKKTTTRVFRQMKERGTPIAMLTAYDYPMAQMADNAGIDGILVGDSLAMVVLGYKNTLSVTLDEMLYHCRAVVRGASTALLIGDMPFLSYQVSTENAIQNAGRFLQEGGMDAVKVEGGEVRAKTIRAIVDAGIPVMGHLGLTPQSVHQLGGFLPQGKTALAAKKLLDDAIMIEDAGCFSIVLESVPARLATRISERLAIPTIGIGAGTGCDGQILVSHDLLGIFTEFTPKFVRKYADLNTVISTAFGFYREDVRNLRFPAREHSFDMSEAEWSEFSRIVDDQSD
jgi:3-methyl-2-oxobutanoate hydroxymethyltransferase